MKVFILILLDVYTEGNLHYRINSGLAYSWKANEKRVASICLAADKVFKILHIK